MVVAAGGAVIGSDPREVSDGLGEYGIAAGDCRAERSRSDAPASRRPATVVVRIPAASSASATLAGDISSTRLQTIREWRDTASSTITERVWHQLRSGRSRDPGGRAAWLGLSGYPRNRVSVTADKEADIGASGDLSLKFWRHHHGVPAAEDLGLARDVH